MDQPRFRISARPPFKLAAPSMVVGDDMVTNVRYLSDLMEHVEIVLFHTPSLHNIPGQKDLEILKDIALKKGLSFTVHLPATLEMASPDDRIRENSLRLAEELCCRMSELNPEYYIIHIPYSRPTLTPVPGHYFRRADKQERDGWTGRALRSLETLHRACGGSGVLLVENINYSPDFLDPLLDRGVCGLCLDLGHLLLGRENVRKVLSRYQDNTREVHMHGVSGYVEHLSLSVLPNTVVLEWVDLLRTSFSGVLTLEVFSREDLQSSISILEDAFKSKERL